MERAKELLRRWSSLLENTGLGIAISSSDGRTLEAMNSAFARMHGYTIEELEGRPIDDLFSPSARPALAENLAVALETGSHSFHSDHVRKDGSVFPVSIDVTIVKASDGERAFRIVHVQDITRRREADAALKAAALSRDVLDRLLEGCQVIGENFEYLYLNDVAVDQARKPREELLGHTMMACYPGIDSTPMFAALRRCMTERRYETMENQFTFPDGTKIHYQLELVPVPQGVCILSLDVTERRNQLAAIVNDSSDAIISRTLDGVIRSWNHGAERIFGFTAKEMIGTTRRLPTPEAYRDDGEEVWQRILRGERIEPYETVRTRKDGVDIDVSITLSPIRDAGSVAGISIIARDVTELRRIHRELERAKDAAEGANKELEAFSYSVAHDLRTPLRAIDGFSQALLEDWSDRLDEEGRDFLRFIREGAQRMAQLIDDMLMLSRVTRSEMTRKQVDLSALAASALARMQRREPTRHVEVVIGPGLSADGDPRLLEIVFENLLGNAWKFSAKTEKAKIEVGAESRDGETSYFVRDNGAGFDMKFAHKLFGAFQRLHGARDFEGTGIGLATVQRVVHRHGGRIWAESEVGKGATFRFTLGAPGDADALSPLSRRRPSR